MSARIGTISDFNDVSFWKTSHEILKAKPKDYYRALKTTVEWAQQIFPKLTTINALNAFLGNVKCWMDHFVLHEIADKSLKLRGAVIDYKKQSPSKATTVYGKVKNSVNQTSSLRSPVLDYIWDASKLAKWAAKYNVVKFSAAFVGKFTAIGGFSFALSNVQQFANELVSFGEIKDNFYLQQTASVYKMARCVATVAMGTIIALGALGFTISPLLFLYFGTMTLITSIAGGFLDSIGKTQYLHDKQEQMQNHWLQRFVSIAK